MLGLEQKHSCCALQTRECWKVGEPEDEPQIDAFDGARCAGLCIDVAEDKDLAACDYSIEIGEFAGEQMSADITLAVVEEGECNVAPLT